MLRPFCLALLAALILPASALATAPTLTYTVTGSNSVLLEWTPVTGATEYRVESSLSGYSLTKETSMPKSITEGAEATVEYKVQKYKPTCTGGCEWSNTVVVKYPTGEPTPLPVGIPGNWTLKLRDEFNANGLNRSLWCVVGEKCGSESFTTKNDGGPECASLANVSEPGDGYVHLKLTNGATGSCEGGPGSLTGARITTGNDNNGTVNYSYKYGVVEWRLKQEGNGTANGLYNWDGVWSLGTGGSWPTHGEFDIWENLGGRPCFTIHGASDRSSICPSGSWEGWHTAALLWQPGVTKAYYDGALIGEHATSPIAVTEQILNAFIASQGCCGGTTHVPGEMLIDYVRVWQ